MLLSVLSALKPALHDSPSPNFSLSSTVFQSDIQSKNLFTNDILLQGCNRK